MYFNEKVNYPEGYHLTCSPAGVRCVTSQNIVSVFGSQLPDGTEIEISIRPK